MSLENAAEADKAKQINSLEYSDKFFSNNSESFSSYITYGSLKTLPGEPCTIKIQGNSVYITSAKNSWSGVIDKNSKTMKLGTIDYVFGEITAERMRRGAPTAKFSAYQFIGNWQEKERKSSQGNFIPIPGGDTLYFTVANDAKSVLYQGTSSKELIGILYVTGGAGGDEVEISRNNYYVVSFSDETLVLRASDNPDLHTMIKVTSFNFLPKERKICENCRIDVLSESLLKQKWISRPQLYVNTFNKTDLAVHTLNITGKKSENEYTGIVTLGDFNMENTLGLSGTKEEDCTVSLLGNNITILSRSFNYTGQIFEATDKSIIFTDKKALIYKLTPEIPGQVPVDHNAFGTNIIDLSAPVNLIRNWHAYNRNANPGYNSEQGLISDLNIVKNLSAMNYEGQVSFSDANRKLFSKECWITLRTPNGNPWIKIETKDKSKVWDFQLYKTDGKELIFGNKLIDGIQYSFY
jgi:hypothetical protein